MSHTQRRIGLIGLMIFGFGAAAFNLFQMIIIINGGYNRNPAIESPVLQTLDAISSTGLWLLAGVVIFLAAWNAYRQQND